MVLFAIFEHGHYRFATGQVYFYESNSKKSANLAACALGAKFSQSKNNKDIKNEYFSVEILQFPFFTSKNNRPKENSK